MSTPAPREYAGPVSRAVAYLMDAFVVAVLCTAAASAASMIASVLGARLHDVALAAASACLVVLPALLATYCAVFWALAGRTPGMAVLGLRVVATRRGRLSWPAALLRALVLAYFPIGAVWALVDRRHQAVHDKVAHTAVVRAPPVAR
ncbi:RDD family protein [Actinoplanes sp. ATCC 53533]|uniref:RDD family protein n=1 Tax=Actinoplanes sp. ATCC 53533 TaxID=1288362 RepID=UPI000F790523|nr:RDD family protein [Actinoplanes sp. ATCC 53533]RSM69576.1 RDD family protein [Actinoplanes sp. ATCC 53533]